MPAVFHSREGIVSVGPEWIARLKAAAAEEPLGRARLCLHHGHDDYVQEMVIAFCRDSLVRPHRHPERSESLHMIEGELTVLIFEDDGKVARRIELAGPGAGGERALLYRVSNGAWHSVVPRSPFVVVHEAAAGPFDPNERHFAPFAPADEAALRAWIARAAEPAAEGMV
jgi:cupin fold WbuC family metalloprotein